MSDTVEFGGWPRPPRWVWAIAGIAAAAVLAGVAITRSAPHRHAPSPAVTSQAAAGRQPGSMGLPPRKPARMAGQPLPHGAGLRLALGGQQPAWLRVATGQAEPIRGLPRDEDGYRLIRVAGGWAALPFPGAGASCADCAPRPAPVYYIADGSRKASRLGVADFAAPAATAGAVWLVSFPTGAVMPAVAGTARQVSVSGATLGPRLRLPRGYVVDQGTTGGLLLAPELAGAGAVRYQLWDPGTGRASRSFPNVVAAVAGEIAWVPPCTERCAVHVLHPGGGPGRVIALPGRTRAYQGAFSPDGRLLALQVTAKIAADGRAATTRLVVADVGTGRLTAVPGTTTGAGNGVDLGWQTGSRQLVADVSLRDGWQIAVWHPGDARLHVAAMRAPAGSWPVIGPGPY